MERRKIGRKKGRKEGREGGRKEGREKNGEIKSKQERKRSTYIPSSSKDITRSRNHLFSHLAS